MTREELISIGKHKVRSSSDLMRIYINLFTVSFGHAPNCASCSFESDWKKFVSLGASPREVARNIDMEKTFKFKSGVPNIIAYKANGKTYYSYSRKATEAYVKEFLSNGTPEQIEERKRLFAELPKNTEEKPKRKRTKK